MKGFILGKSCKTIENFLLSLFLFITIFVTTNSYANLITFDFEGQMDINNLSDWPSGDKFYGSYTFDAESLPSIVDTQSDKFTYLSLTTPWDLNFPTFRLTGTGVKIIVGNDTYYGDSYVVSFIESSRFVGFGSSNTILPSGDRVLDFMFHLKDQWSGNADLLSDDSIQTTPPDLSLTTPDPSFPFSNTEDHGELNTASSFMDIDQYLTLTSLTKHTPVPEPTTIALLGIGLAGLACAETKRRLQKRIVDNS